MTPIAMLDQDRANTRLEELDPIVGRPSGINRISGGSFLRWFVGFRLCRTCQALLRLRPGFPQLLRSRPDL